MIREELSTNSDCFIFQETYNLAVGKTHSWEHVGCVHWRDHGLKYLPKCVHLGSLGVQGGSNQYEALLDERKSSRKNDKNQVTQCTRT